MHIEVGKTYRESHYDGATLVLVTEYLPDTWGWYYDHQGGGWNTRGCFRGLILEGYHFGEDWDYSAEYARDNWEPDNARTSRAARQRELNIEAEAKRELEQQIMDAWYE